MRMKEINHQLFEQHTSCSMPMLYTNLRPLKNNDKNSVEEETKCKGVMWGFGKEETRGVRDS